jgi:hypothetical protein
MTTINVLLETPKTIQRTILAVGKIHYQPPAEGQSGALEVVGWMLIQDEIQPVNEPEFTQ